MQMTDKNIAPIFDYRALRLLMGLIAFALPFVVSVQASTVLSSISASYHTDARDMFVGLLFVVSAFLWSYNGHTVVQSYASKIAGLAAAMVALFPATCDTCTPNTGSIIHYISAALLFSVLAYFCLGPFRRDTKGQHGKKGRRSAVYLVCGLIMIVCMSSIGVAYLTYSKETVTAWRLVFWAESGALIAFGVAWIVSGKHLRVFTDQEERLHIFKRRG